jgi:uncharacterized protein YbcV (DUF1398 family)
MFTLDQVRSAHTKVKSGADFPSYVQDLKALGVLSYEHFLLDGHSLYHGKKGFELSAPAKWNAVKIAPVGNRRMLKQAIGIHQAGQTDYLTFCKQAAKAGVDKWIVDIESMTCSYFDLAGNEMVVEEIPEAIPAHDVKPGFHSQSRG